MKPSTPHSSKKRTAIRHNNSVTTSATGASPFQITSYSSKEGGGHSSQKHKSPSSTNKRRSSHKYRPNSAPSTKLTADDTGHYQQTSTQDQERLPEERNLFQTSSNNKETHQSAGSSGRRASDFIHRFRNAPPMSREERRRQKQKLLQERKSSHHHSTPDSSSQRSSGHFFMANSNLSRHKQSRGEKRPKSSSATQRPSAQRLQSPSSAAISDHFVHQQRRNKSPYLHKATSPSSSKRSKRRRSDSSLLLHGHRMSSVNGGTSHDTTPKKRRSVDHFRRGSVDKSLTMSMIKNNLRSEMFSNDPSIKPDYNKVKSDVKRMFADADVSVSTSLGDVGKTLDTTSSPRRTLDGARTSAKSPIRSKSSSKKRPKSSLSHRSSSHKRRGSPASFRRYSPSPTFDRNSSDKLPEGIFVSPKQKSKARDTTPQHHTPIEKRSQSPYLQTLNSASPSSRRARRRRSTPERRVSPAHQHSSRRRQSRGSNDELTPFTTTSLSSAQSPNSPSSPLTPSSLSKRRREKSRSKSASSIRSRSSKRVRRRIPMNEDLESSVEHSQQSPHHRHYSEDSQHTNGDLVIGGSNTQYTQETGTKRPLSSQHPRRSSAPSMASPKLNAAHGQPLRSLHASEESPIGFSSPEQRKRSSADVQQQEKEISRRSSEMSRHEKASVSVPEFVSTGQRDVTTFSYTADEKPDPASLPQPADPNSLHEIKLRAGDAQFRSNLREHTSDTLNYVFSNMKLKTFFKFTIEEAPVMKRPHIRQRGRKKSKSSSSAAENSSRKSENENRSSLGYSDSLKDDPLLNVLQKRVEMVREKIGLM